MGGAAKQFRMLGDAPVLIQTLRAFNRVSEITTLVVVVPEGASGEVEGLIVEYGLKVTAVVGGATRQASVANGIAAIPDLVGIVLVHDAVRPFVSGQQIREVIAAIHEHGAAAVAVPIADTLRRASGDRFGDTVDRQDLFRMLTPQGARTELLGHACRQAAEDGFEATDEVEVLQRSGTEVRLVIGDERNIKLTRPSDWALANALWSDWKKSEE